MCLTSNSIPVSLILSHKIDSLPLFNIFLHIHQDLSRYSSRFIHQGCEADVVVTVSYSLYLSV